MTQTSRINVEHTMVEKLRDSYLLHELKAATSISEKNQIFKDYLGLYGKTTIKGSGEDRWKIVKETLSGSKFDLSDLEHTNCLFQLSYFIPNGSQSSSLQEMTLERLLDTSFDQGYDFLMNEHVQKNLRTSVPVIKFVEEKATTHADFEKLSTRIDRILNLQEETPSLKNLVIFEELMQKVDTNKSMFNLFSAMLKSQHDELPLKKILYSTVGQLRSVDEVAQSLYRAPVHQRYSIIRAVLTGEKGILTSPVGRRDLHSAMMSEVLEEPIGKTDLAWYQNISGITEEFVLNADIENLYFVVVPLLMDQILNPPKDSTDIKTLIEAQVVKTNRSFIPSDEEAELQLRMVRGEDVEDEFTQYILDEYGIRDSWKEVLDFNQTNDNIRGQIEMELESNRKSTKSRKRKTNSSKLDKIIGKPKSRSEGKLSVLEFIVTAAKNLGAPGVRFLQMLGQYVTIPEEYQQEFNQVYDGVAGQSKLAAYMLLEREWDGFKDEVVEFLPAIGGGSLMTVYKVVTASGETEVVKVLNPNADFHTEVSFNVMKEIIQAKAEKDPAYKIAIPLLDDIREWIIKDISFTNFLEEDKKFYNQNHGFTSTNPTASESSLEYKIRVPISTGVENKYFKREKYIDGVNLTQEAELASRGHDTKAIVSLLAQNYLSQIASGHVHSDVHPGNFRITDDGEVAILDRNYFLGLDFQDQALLYTMGQDVPSVAKAETIATYLQQYNDHVGQGFKNKVERIIDESEGVQQLGDVVRYIRQSNLKFPIKMSLMIKNLFALNSLSQSVGFDTVQDAISYDSSQNQ
jgi:predicted unusual protein kinase regulating ubiquinone biosynthesis (AarF/ABC1/UbiB family)